MSKETLEQKVERLTKELKAQEEANKALGINLKEASLVIQEQSEKLDSVSIEKENNAPVMKVGKDLYKIAIGKFRHDGVEVTADELKKNPELAKELIKIGSGVLLPIVNS
jgi:multidrug resistance efflux pump